MTDHRYFWAAALVTALAAAGALGASLLCGNTVSTAAVTEIAPGAEQAVQSAAVQLARGQSLRLDSVFDYDFQNSALITIDVALTSETGRSLPLSTSLSLGDSQQGSGTQAWDQLGEFVVPEEGKWTLNARIRTATDSLHIARGELRLKTGTVNGFDSVPILITIAFALFLLGHLLRRARQSENVPIER